MGTHPIFESDFDCLTEKNVSVTNADRDAAGHNDRDRQRTWSNVNRFRF